MEGILEGLLFIVGDEGLSLEEAMSILNIDENQIQELINNLKTNYQNPNRGLTLNYLGNTLKLTTKPEHKDYYEKLLERTKTHPLSQAALEVLAIVAYNEPLTRSEIDEMRGVDSVYVIRKLIARGLLKDAGKSDKPGHPILYKTTNEFLDYFGLSTIEDLPKIEEITNIEEEQDLFNSNYKEEKER